MTAMRQKLRAMILPPPATPSDEEPIAAGGWRVLAGDTVSPFGNGTWNNFAAARDAVG